MDTNLYLKWSFKYFKNKSAKVFFLSLPEFRGETRLGLEGDHWVKIMGTVP